MDAERRDHVCGARMELVERLEHSPTGTDLVQVYRDAEGLLTTAQRLDADCAQARKLEVLVATQSTLSDARRLIEKSPSRAQPVLVEVLSAIQEQEKQIRQLRGMYSNQWPELEALKRLQGAASDLRDVAEGKARAFEQRTAARADGSMQQRPSGPDKPKRGPRLG